MKVVITGSQGMLGWHLHCHLHNMAAYEVASIERGTWASETLLGQAFANCDVVVHLAGMNRGAATEIEQTNIGLAERLINALQTRSLTPDVIFASSTHVTRDTAYGRSKRAATELFFEWSVRHKARFTNLVLPHVFGEQGKPFYNSVVSTFCYQMARGERPTIDNDGDLELLHAQDVAAVVTDAFSTDLSSEIRPQGTKLRVSDLLSRLETLDATYRNGLIPDLHDPLDLRLFNTLRSYLFPRYYPVSLPLKRDARGSLVELVKTLHGGQSFVSLTHPNVTRGNHYHLRKLERFLVIAGQALIRVRRLFDDTIHEFRVDGTSPQYIDMPTLHSHNITNIGESELLTLFWSHDLFDPKNTDTYPEPV